MNYIPTPYISEKDQGNKLTQLYNLLSQQVNSYQKAGHMRSGSSVPSELAQELLRSVCCTLDLAGGVGKWQDLRQGMQAGQALLKEKQIRAKQQFLLVETTLPEWIEECRADAIQALRVFLGSYDPVHLAHICPETGCYPIMTPIADAPSGIDSAAQILDQLWWENQIMGAFSENAFHDFQNVFCQFDRGLSENQCQQLLIQGVGKLLLGESLDRLTFLSWEREALCSQLSANGSAPKEQLVFAAKELTAFINLSGPKAVRYAQQAAVSFLPRLTVALQSNDVSTIFL